MANLLDELIDALLGIKKPSPENIVYIVAGETDRDAAIFVLEKIQ